MNDVKQDLDGARLDLANSEAARDQLHADIDTLNAKHDQASRDWEVRQGELFAQNDSLRNHINEMNLEKDRTLEAHNREIAVLNQKFTDERSRWNDDKLKLQNVHQQAVSTLNAMFDKERKDLLDKMANQLS